MFEDDFLPLFEWLFIEFAITPAFDEVECVGVKATHEQHPFDVGWYGDRSICCEIPQHDIHPTKLLAIQFQGF